MLGSWSETTLLCAGLKQENWELPGPRTPTRASWRCSQAPDTFSPGPRSFAITSHHQQLKDEVCANYLLKPIITVVTAFSAE